MKKILIIAAHPDDDVLGCGGVISKFSSKGYEFRVIFVAEGSSCRFQKIGADEIEAVIQKRNQFGINALNKLSIDNYHFYNLPCGRLDTVPIIEINKIIEDEINRFRPDTVLTHSENDTNNDHVIIFKSTIMATRPSAQFVVRNVISYEILSSSEWKFSKSFEPNIFIEISEKDVENKYMALLEYKSEVKKYPFPRSIDGIKVLAQYRGMQSGVNYAEAFKIIRKFDDAL